MDFSEGTLNPEGSPIQILWKNGRTQIFSAAFLRAHCPCSSCRNSKIELLPAMFPNLTVLATNEVGSYALQFKFSDGHGTGAFSIDYLLKLPDKG